MKTLTILFALVYIYRTSEGNDTLSLKRNNLIFIGFNISPDYSYTTSPNAPGITFTDKYGPKLGYTAGANICYQIGKRISFETGFEYSNKGYKIKSTDIGIFNNDSALTLIKATGIVSAEYWDIPFKMNIAFIDKKIQILTEVGMTADVFIKTIHTIYIVDNNYLSRGYIESTHYTKNKISFSPTVSVGLKYTINDKMNIRIEPTYRYMLSTIYDNQHLWSMGLNIGYYFKINYFK